MKKHSEDESALATTWSGVEQMIRKNAFPKWAGRTLGALIVVMIVIVGIGAWNLHRVNTLAAQNHTLFSEIKAGNIATCEAGNAARATNKKIWDDFLNLLTSNPVTPATKAALTADIIALDLPASTQTAMEDLIDAEFTNNPQAVKLVKVFEDYITTHEYTVNCSKEYNTTAAAASDPVELFSPPPAPPKK